MTTRLIILTLSLLAASATAQQARIVGGWPADQYKYRSTAQLDYLNIFSGAWNQACACTILNIRYCLTAAHCVDAPPSARRLRVGSTHRNTGGVVHPLESIRIHPKFDISGLDNDIALCRVYSPFTYNDAVGPASVISAGSQLPYGTKVNIAGWGTTSSNSTVASPELLETEVYVINQEVCRSRYAELKPQPATVTENMFCAGISNEGGRDACLGDSGGPVLLADILVGIISWGHSCADPHYYGVNTAVSSFTEWIVSNTST